MLRCFVLSHPPGAELCPGRKDLFDPFGGDLPTDWPELRGESDQAAGISVLNLKPDLAPHDAKVKVVQ